MVIKTDPPCSPKPKSRYRQNQSILDSNPVRSFVYFSEKYSGHSHSCPATTPPSSQQIKAQSLIENCNNSGSQPTTSSVVWFLIHPPKHANAITSVTHPAFRRQPLKNSRIDSRSVNRCTLGSFHRGHPAWLAEK